MLLFSDGVPDAVNMFDEVYGNRRLAQLFTQKAHLPANDLAQAIAGGVAQWSQGAAAFDDITLLVVEVEGSKDEQ